MFQNISVKNFRGLGSLLLHPLGRVNLIAGKNNTGKTALLEAISLHCNPEDGQLPLRINESRGVAPTSKSLEEVCGWLFFDRNAANRIELTSQSDRGETRDLTIALLDRFSLREQFPPVHKMLREAFSSELGDVNQAVLVLRYRGPHGEEAHGFCMAVKPSGFLEPTGFSYFSPRVPLGIPSVFLNSAAMSSAEDVKRFSELEGANRQGEILPALRILEQRLLRLSLIVFAGNTCIHGDVGLSRMVPVSFLGEGMRRLLSIMLAIATTKSGAVLIDEVENGLHYSVMQSVWEAIAAAARDLGVQVFATTHSYECIAAAHRAFKQREPYEFRYFRLDRRGEEFVVKSFDKEMLDAVEASDLEVR